MHTAGIPLCLCRTFGGGSWGNREHGHEGRPTAFSAVPEPQTSEPPRRAASARRSKSGQRPGELARQRHRQHRSERARAHLRGVRGAHAQRRSKHLIPTPSPSAPLPYTKPTAQAPSVAARLRAAALPPLPFPGASRARALSTIRPPAQAP